MMPRIDPTTQPERDRAERGYTATVASVGGGLDQFPSDTVRRFGRRHQVVSACISASSARISSIAMRSRRTISCSSCCVAVTLAATSTNLA